METFKAPAKAQARFPDFFIFGRWEGARVDWPSAVRDAAMRGGPEEAWGQTPLRGGGFRFSGELSPDFCSGGAGRLPCALLHQRSGSAGNPSPARRTLQILLGGRFSRSRGVCFPPAPFPPPHSLRQDRTAPPTPCKSGWALGSRPVGARD